MFRTVQGKNIDDVVQYVKNYLSVHKNEHIDIIVGCDSQNYNRYTAYATVIALYNEGHGGHIIYQKEKTDRERVRATRLLNEVAKSIETAEMLKLAGLPKVKYIDIDINPCEKYKSNEVFSSAVGMVKGMGYDCRCKTLGAAVTYCADWMVRN